MNENTLYHISPLTQPAENGAYPQLICAAEKNLDQKEFYGPTGRSNWVGPIGSHELKPQAKDKEIAKKLWEVTEEATGIKWNING